MLLEAKSLFESTAFDNGVRYVEKCLQNTRFSLTLS